MKQFFLFIFCSVQAVFCLAQTPCREVIGYYPGWQWYDRTQMVSPTTIKYQNYTILNYAFFYPRTDGWIVQTADSTWGDPILLEGPMNWTTNQRDITKSLPYLSHQNGVKILPSVGGWTFSDNFPQIAASAVKRKMFAHSCNNLIRKYDFDGIDIDWEYPGYADHGGSPADKVNFTLLMREIRDSLNSIEVQRGRHLLLTAAVGASPTNMANVEWTNIAALLDIINLMSYDFYGAFDSRCNHNSPLYATGGTGAQAGFSIDEAVTTLMQTYGVPANKIAAGLAFYGRSQVCSSTPVLHGVSNGAADITNFATDEGSPQYYNILPKLGNGFTRYWDNVAKVPYAISTANNSFVSYDDEQSIGLKAQYINQKNLRGAIIWEITGDYFQGAGSTLRTPLADTLNRTFCMGTTPNIAPSITITTPSNAQNFAVAPSTVSLSANASDADGTVAAVEFYHGATLLGSDNSAPYSFSWANLPQGAYTVRAKAVDNGGATTWSSSVSFTVGTVVNQAPTVSFTTDNTVYTAPATVLLTATPADADGTITKVEFYNGATLLATKTAAPYIYTWSGVAQGAYSLTAKAFDNSNVSTVSALRNITVNANTGNPLCGSPTFVMGGTYATGANVTNSVNGVNYVYECTVGGWCSQTSAANTAYVPGTGWAWQSAWTQITACVVGTENVHRESIKIQPNPFNTLLLLDKGTNDFANIVVTNALGQVIAQSNFTAQTHVFETENWAAGVYFVRLSGKSGSATLRVVKN
jgi:GH18 family chitinase